MTRRSRRLFAPAALLLLLSLPHPAGDAMAAPAPQAWTRVEVPGVALRLDLGAGEADSRATGQAVVDGAVLVGPGAFVTVLARLDDPTPTQVAELACLLADSGAATSPPVDRAFAEKHHPGLVDLVTEPALYGDAVVYWRPHGQVDDLLRVTVGLDGTVRSREHGADLSAPPGPDDPVVAARQTLAGKYVSYAKGIAALEGAVAHPGGPELVAESLAGHPLWRVREAAAGLLVQHPTPDARARLETALAGDESLYVRAASATALGELGDPAARPALETASRKDPAAQVKDAAKAALKGLSGGGGGAGGGCAGS